jgi:hypothetical protein
MIIVCLVVACDIAVILPGWPDHIIFEDIPQDLPEGFLDPDQNGGRSFGPNPSMVEWRERPQKRGKSTSC